MKGYIWPAHQMMKSSTPHLNCRVWKPQIFLNFETAPQTSVAFSKISPQTSRSLFLNFYLLPFRSPFAVIFSYSCFALNSLSSIPQNKDFSTAFSNFRAPCEPTGVANQINLIRPLVSQKPNIGGKTNSSDSASSGKSKRVKTDDEKRGSEAV